MNAPIVWNDGTIYYQTRWNASGKIEARDGMGVWYQLIGTCYLVKEDDNGNPRIYIQEIVSKQ